MMNYTFTNHEDILILRVDNLMLDYENTRLLREVEQHIEGGYIQYIIDLSLLKMINSVGLSFLIAVLTKSRNQGGETIIANISPQINQILAITKLQSIFTVATSTEEAIEIMEQERATTSTPVAFE